MKKIFLYLLIFAVLINVFTYAYFTKKQKHEAELQHNTVLKLEQKKQLIDSLDLKIFEMSHYSLQGNDSSLDYLDRYRGREVVKKIEDSILSLNHVRGGNKLIGFDYPEDPIVISRMQFMNHRWILADFDNSTLGGQVLIRYYINDDATFEMEVIDKAMYLPKTLRAD
ncbi:MAG TPA: hypothetical protein VLZ11_01345 [Flavobacterium sp.]|nr:hypothetical protein [Flavobacterium sp.]